MKTKNVMLTLGLFLISITLMQAQFRERFSIGPRAGVNFSNVSNLDGSKSLTGLVLGLTSTYSFNESSGLTIDLLYAQEGYKTPVAEVDQRLDYLQVPILFDLFFGTLGKPFRPKVYLGVVPGFLLGAKLDGNTVNKDIYNGFYFGLGGGLGFNYRVGSKIWLNVDLRAQMGLTDIRDNKVGDQIALRTVQPSIGLAYGLSKL